MSSERKGTRRAGIGLDEQDAPTFNEDGRVEERVSVRRPQRRAGAASKVDGTEIAEAEFARHATRIVVGDGENDAGLVDDHRVYVRKARIECGEDLRRRLAARRRWFRCGARRFGRATRVSSRTCSLEHFSTAPHENEALREDQHRQPNLHAQPCSRESETITLLGSNTRVSEKGVSAGRFRARPSVLGTCRAPIRAISRK